MRLLVSHHSALSRSVRAGAYYHYSLQVRLLKLLAIKHFYGGSQLQITVRTNNIRVMTNIAKLTNETRLKHVCVISGAHEPAKSGRRSVELSTQACATPAYNVEIMR